MTDFMPDPVDKVLRNIMLDLIQPFMNKFGNKFKFMTKYFWDRHTQFGSPGESCFLKSCSNFRRGAIWVENEINVGELENRNGILQRGVALKGSIYDQKKHRT